MSAPSLRFAPVLSVLLALTAACNEEAKERQEGPSGETGMGGDVGAEAGSGAGAEGGSGEMNGAAKQTFVYVSNRRAKNLRVLELDAANGQLTERQTFDLGGGGPGPQTYDASKGVLYVGIDNPPKVVSFELADDGNLTGPSSTVEVSGLPVHLTMSGDLLISTSYAADSLTVLSRLPNGQLTEPILQTLESVGDKPHSAWPDPQGARVYVPILGEDVIAQYALNPSGLEAVAGANGRVATDKGAGPRHMAFHPKLPVLYSVEEHSGAVTRYAIDEGTGRLQPQESVSALPNGHTGDPAGADIVVHPSGEHLYASIRGSSSITHFAVDVKTGELTADESIPVPATPRDFAMDPAGLFIVSVGQDSGGLGVYRVRTDGSLKETSVFEQTEGENARPIWVTIVAR